MDERKAPNPSWSIITTYLALMAAGLLLVQVLLFFLTVMVRAEDQYYLAMNDRTRLAATLHQVFAPLDPEKRIELAASLRWSSFSIEVAETLPFVPGQDKNSLYFQNRIRTMLRQNVLLDAEAEIPEVRTLVRNFQVHWSVFPFFLHRMYDSNGNNSPFEAMTAIALSHGQWLIINNLHIFRVDNNLFGLLVELLAQFVLIMALSLLVIRYVTKPLRQLAHYADHFTPETPNLPLDSLPARGPSEVMRMSRAMQDMYQRIRGYIDERVRMLASISHDLRSPIHSMRMYLEKDPDHAHQPQLLEALDDLQRLAHDAVTLARTGVNDEAVQPTDLQALLENLVLDYQEYLALRPDSADETVAGLRYYPLNQRVSCQLRPLTFKRCVQNIVDNALRYGFAADIYLEKDDSQIMVRVVDKGPGIPEHLLEEVFKPFFRHQPNRGPGEGNGLGLSIARDLARQNNAELTCRNLPEGGLEVRITLLAQS